MITPPNYVTTFPRDHLKESLSENEVVVDHTSNSKHSQPSILKFLQLHVGNLGFTLSLQLVQGVKSKVTWDTIRISEHVLHGDISLVGTPFLSTGEEDNLEHARNTNSSRCQVGVIDMNVSEHGEADELLCHESGSGKHGNAAVLDFCFLEPFDVEVFGEADGVESYGTDEAVGLGRVEEEWDRFGHFCVEGGGCLASLGRGKSRSRPNKGGDGGSLHHG
mmetsp:Transcript_25063/g.39386  ORF Transcript_25063/g.39386 Transcript_25063/m.39386 type:complete len:220 (-) Transcript_25063:39-698(-)